jgi:hypothetical protein
MYVCRVYICMYLGLCMHVRVFSVYVRYEFMHACVLIYV